VIERLLGRGHRAQIRPRPQPVVGPVEVHEGPVDLPEKHVLDTADIEDVVTRLDDVLDGAVDVGERVRNDRGCGGLACDGIVGEPALLVDLGSNDTLGRQVNAA
jgi:hypothetical protein